MDFKTFINDPRYKALDDEQKKEALAYFQERKERELEPSLGERLGKAFTRGLVKYGVEAPANIIAPLLPTGETGEPIVPIEKVSDWAKQREQLLETPPSESKLVSVAESITEFAPAMPALSKTIVTEAGLAVRGLSSFFSGVMYSKGAGNSTEDAIKDGLGWAACDAIFAGAGHLTKKILGKMTVNEKTLKDPNFLLKHFHKHLNEADKTTFFKNVREEMEHFYGNGITKGYFEIKQALKHLEKLDLPASEKALIKRHILATKLRYSLSEKTVRNKIAEIPFKEKDIGNMSFEGLDATVSSAIDKIVSGTKTKNIETAKKIIEKSSLGKEGKEKILSIFDDYNKTIKDVTYQMQKIKTKLPINKEPINIPNPVFAEVKKSYEDIAKIASENNKEISPEVFHSVPKELKKNLPWGKKYTYSPLWTWKGVAMKHEELVRDGEYYYKIGKDIAKPFFNMTGEKKEKVKKVILEQMKNGKDYTENELKFDKKFTDDMVEATTAYRKAYDYVMKSFIPKILRESGKSRQYIDDFTNKHYREGYTPSYWFGDYLVVAQDKSKKKVFEVASADTKNEWDAVYNMLYKKYPEADFKFINLQNNSARDDYLKMHVLGFYVKDALKDLPKEFKDYIKGKIDDKLMKYFLDGRLIKKYNIPGFSTDLDKVMENYLQKTTHGMVNTFKRREVYNEIKKLPIYQQGLARKWYEEVLAYRGSNSIQNAASKIVYFAYLGLKPWFAFRNITQRITTGFPRLVAETGGSFPKAVSHSVSAEKDMFKFYKTFWVKHIKDIDPMKFEDILTRDTQKNIKDRYTKTLMLRLLREGSLVGKVGKEATEKGMTNKFEYLLNVFVSHSDTSNRLHTALSFIKVAKDKKMSLHEALPYVREMIAKTQWLYETAQRPPYLKDWGRVAFMFSSWKDNYIRSLIDLYKNDKKAMFTQMAIMLGLGGTAGAPFVKDIENLGDKIAKRYNYPEWFRMKRQIWQQLPKEFREGLTSYIGLPGSWSFGLGSAVPTSLPIVSLSQEATKFVSFFTDYIKGNISLTDLLSYCPISSIRHLTVALSEKGMLPTDPFGKPKHTLQDIKSLPLNYRKEAFEWYKKLPKEWAVSDKVLYALGATCLSKKEITDYWGSLKGEVEATKNKKAYYHQVIGKAIADGDVAHSREIFHEAQKAHISLDWKAIQRNVAEYSERVE